MIMTGDFQKDGKMLKEQVRKHLNAQLNLLPIRIKKFAHDRCVLSGGCFASIMHNESVNDYDFWCLDSADIPEMERVLDTLTKKEADSMLIENPAYMDQFVDGKIVTANAVTLKNKVQFVKLSNFATAKDSFDFEHCRISYIPATDILYMSRTQYDSIRKKQLIETDKKRVISQRRLNKFYTRGWSLA